jgi:predicted permease
VKVADIWLDVRYGIRLAFHKPLFAITVMGSLTLGVGLSTAVFSFLNALFLRPLPGVAEPGRLVYLASGNRTGMRQMPISYPNYRDLRERAHSFSDLAAYQSIRVGLAAGNGEPDQVSGEIVTNNFFTVLGSEPALARGFAAVASPAPGTQAEVIVGDGLWQRRFGSDPGIIGREILLNGQPFTVVGVARRGFKGMTNFSAAELWVPLSMYPAVLPVPKLLEDRGNQTLRVVGRLRSGAGASAAAAELEAIATRLEREYPAANEGLGIAVTPLVRPPSLKSGPQMAGAVLLILMGFLLLIVCFNVINMLLARAIARRTELAVRLALGASRGRLARQLITESLVLTLTGSAGGLLAAFWGVGFLWRLRPPALEAAAVSLSLDGKVLAFSFVTVLVTSLAVSLLPALRAGRMDVAATLRGERGFVRWGKRRGSLSHGLVVFQVALCALCLSCAGLFLQSFYGLLQIDPGFDPAHLLSVSFDLQAQGKDETGGRDLQRRLLERVTALPGVQSAALAESRPLGGFRLWRQVLPLGGARSAGNGKKPDQAGSLIVDPGYFRTLGIPVQTGRSFTARDRAGAPPVAIVNRALARRFWPSTDPVGTRVLLDAEPEPVEIVGVVGDAKLITLDETFIPLVYLPLAQRYTARATLAVRTAGEPGSLLGPVRRAVSEVAPILPLSDLLTGSEAIARSLWMPRAGALLLGLLGLLALFLAMSGVYGITAYTVVQRGREIGIRAALGARPGLIVRTLVRGGMTVLMIGLGLGLSLAFLAGKLISRLVYGAQGGGPLILALIALSLIGVGALANAIPAFQAARMNPAVDLRRGE